MHNLQDITAHFTFITAQIGYQRTPESDKERTKSGESGENEILFVSTA